MNEGFIKLFRSLLDWEWYDDINVKVLFIHLLLKCNYQDKTWRWIKIKKWELLTSRENLSIETKLSVMQIRTALKKLKSTGDITIKTTNNYTLLKLNNYNKYNWNNQQHNQQITNKQLTDNQQITTTKERKEIKKDNNIIINNNTEQSSEIIKEVEDRFWNKEINELQDFIKQQVELSGFIYKAWKYERARIKNLLTAKKIQELLEKFDLNIYEFVQKIIFLSSKLDFWAWKITNAETFYKHYDKILNEAIKLKQEKKQKEQTFKNEVF